ncbi:MAG TPA: hypothetical protein VLF68_00635 [Candidatus Saccharimonadales bacterium]|nr:hypothetical protein [Candidatus Saccharimonadales bacterium]
MDPNQPNQVPPVQNLPQTPVPSANQTPPAPHFPKTLLIGVVVFILVILGAGAFVLQSKNNKQQIAQLTPAPTKPITPPSTPDPTANWKTYTNTMYGYTLKYPNTWEAWNGLYYPAQISSSQVIQIISKPDYIPLIQKAGILLENFEKNDYAWIEINVTPLGQQYNHGNELETVTTSTDIPTFFGFKDNSQEITLNGQVAYSMVKPIAPREVSTGFQNGILKRVATRINGNIVNMDAQYPHGFTETNSLAETFDQILSTFKFTDSPNQPSSWKIFQGKSTYSQYPSLGNFMISYPPTCTLEGSNRGPLIDCPQFSMNPQAGGHGASLIKEDTVVLNGITWTRRLLDKGDNTVGYSSYETGTNNTTQLVEVIYKTYSQSVQKDVEAIIATFKPL